MFIIICRRCGEVSERARRCAPYRVGCRVAAGAAATFAWRRRRRLGRAPTSPLLCTLLLRRCYYPLIPTLANTTGNNNHANSDNRALSITCQSEININSLQSLKTYGNALQFLHSYLHYFCIGINTNVFSSLVEFITSYLRDTVRWSFLFILN